MPHDTETENSTGQKVLMVAVMILAIAGIVVSVILFSKAEVAENNIRVVLTNAVSALKIADAAKAVAEEASVEASRAKSIAMITASDEYKPMDSKDNPLSREEKAAITIAAARKKAADDATARFEKLALRVDTHDEMFKTLDEENTKTRTSVNTASNVLTTALTETETRINTSTDEKIRLSLKDVATQGDIQALRSSADSLRAKYNGTDATMAALATNMTALSNRLASGVKDIKPPKAKGTNAAVVTAGSVVTNKVTMLSGSLERTGHPVTKTGWFGRKKAVEVTYKITLNAPSDINTGLGEAEFQKFEGSRPGLMSDLATLKASDAKAVARLSRELTAQFGAFLAEEKILPNGVTFVGATAIPSKAASTVPVSKAP